MSFRPSLVLVCNRPGDRYQIRSSALQDQSAAHLQAGNIRELGDHARELTGGRVDSVQFLPQSQAHQRRTILDVLPEQFRGEPYRCQRLPEVMAYLG
jgi:hypothetical protein